MGIASLILGILSLCCCGCWTGVPALILGGIAMFTSEDSSDKICGIIGAVLGTIGTLITIVVIAIYGVSGVLAFATAIAESASQGQF